MLWSQDLNTARITLNQVDIKGRKPFAVVSVKDNALHSAQIVMTIIKLPNGTAAAAAP